MNTIPFLLGTDFVSLIFEGQPVTIYKNDSRFPEVLKCIRDKNWKNLEEVLSVAKIFAKYTSGNIQVFDDHITYKGEKLNNIVAERIFEFIREQLPFEPLVKFLDKLMQNPNPKSIERLYKFMENYKLPITEDGDVIGMKSVTEEFKDHYTGTLDYSVGTTHKIDRSLIEGGDSECNGPGLHVGAYNYVNNYVYGNAVLVKFNPKNVCRVPSEANFGKIVVCEFEVIKYIGKSTEISEFNSNYAPNTKQASGLYEKVKREDTDELVKQIAAKNYIGADKAYILAKQGKKVRSGSITVSKPHSRSYFRKFKNWQIV